MKFWTLLAYAACLMHVAHTTSARVLANRSLATPSPSSQNIYENAHPSFHNLSENKSLDLLLQDPRRPRRWDACMERGRALYAAFERASGPDPFISTEELYDDFDVITKNWHILHLHNYRFVNRNIPRTRCGYELSDSMISFTINWPKGWMTDGTPWSDVAVFSGAIDPTRRLLTIDYAKRGAMHRDVHLSHLAWAAWILGLKRAWPDEWHRHISDLKYIMKDLVNHGQVSILEWAVRYAGGLTSRELPVKFPRESEESYKKDAFYALLGTKAGAEIVQFLTDNKVALRGRWIKEVHVVFSENRPALNDRAEYRTIVVTLEDSA